MTSILLCVTADFSHTRYYLNTMADSDDEYDRRRRDKFRRERSDYDRSREREDRRRDDWNDRWGLKKHLTEYSQFFPLGLW